MIQTAHEEQALCRKKYEFDEQERRQAEALKLAEHEEPESDVFTGPQHSQPNDDDAIRLLSRMRGREEAREKAMREHHDVCDRHDLPSDGQVPASPFEQEIKHTEQPERPETNNDHELGSQLCHLTSPETFAKLTLNSSAYSNLEDYVERMPVYLDSVFQNALYHARNDECPLLKTELARQKVRRSMLHFPNQDCVKSL